MHLRRVEVAAELLLGAALEVSRRVHDLRPTAVIEGDIERDAAVFARRLLRPLHALVELRRDSLAAADEAHPHSLLVELRRLGVDPLAEHPHQPFDLFLWPRPVLGRERKDGELPDAELGSIAEACLDYVGAGPVPLDRRQASLLRPAPVP